MITIAAKCEELYPTARSRASSRRRSKTFRSKTAAIPKRAEGEAETAEHLERREIRVLDAMEICESFFS